VATYAEDSAPAYTRYLGVGQSIIDMICTPPLNKGASVVRRSDFAGLILGRWRRPNFVSLSEDGGIWRIGFGPGNVPTRIRFGNPNNDYPNILGGQLREFSLPVPYRTTALPFDSPLARSRWWQQK